MEEQQEKENGNNFLNSAFNALKGRFNNFQKILRRIFLKVLVTIAPYILGIIGTLFLIAAIDNILNGNKDKNIAYAMASATTTTTTIINEFGQEIIIPPPITVKPLKDGYYQIEFNEIDDNLIDEAKTILQENGVDIEELTETEIKFITALYKVEEGYNLNTANVEEIKALFLFFKAEIASQSLDLRPEEEMFDNNNEYIKPELNQDYEDRIPGTVRLERITAEEENIAYKKITYKPYEEYINSENREDYFTLHEETGNLIVATTKKVEYKYSDDYEGEQKEPIITYETFGGETGVEYKNYISQYSMPFNLLSTLMVHSEDIEFCTNLANSVTDGNIVLALREDITKETKKIEYENATEYYYDFEYNVLGTAFEGTLSIGEILPKLREFGYTDDFQLGDMEIEWNVNNINYTAEISKIPGGLIYNVIIKEETSVSEKPLKEEGKLYSKRNVNETYEVTQITTQKTLTLETKQAYCWSFELEQEYILPEIKEEPITLPEDEDLGEENYKNFACNVNVDFFNEEKYLQEDIIIKYKSRFKEDYTWSKSLAEEYTKTEDNEKPIEISMEKTEIPKGELITNIRDAESENSFLFFYKNARNYTNIF